VKQHADREALLFLATLQAMSILRGQLPWRKRARPEPSAAAAAAASPSGGGMPLRAAMSAPPGGLDAALAAAPQDGEDGEWSLTGPYNFDRWRDMIERCA
jgi:hypothetical protein